MLCRYLGCKLFMDSLSLAGIAVQNEEENVISDKIVIPILVILTLSKGRTVGDIEVFIEILAAGVTVFFQRVIIGYVMVSHYWSQRDSVERKMLQIESIMFFASEISHLISKMKEKICIRHIGNNAVQDTVPTFSGNRCVLHIRLPNLSVCGDKKS